MNENIIPVDDIKIIRKKYGENFSNLCKILFPTLLEKPGLLFKLISENFAESHYIYDDIFPLDVDEFKDYIYGLLDVKKEEISIIDSPEVLLQKAGYVLYECKTEEDIQSFKKYYEKREELCTFGGNRLNRCHVFFAVKRNVNSIRREDFPIPERQDEYGTSVISIQFFRGENNVVSIKNRYNHSVNNPDATFSNNLDNIIPGLTSAFATKYGFNFSQGLSMFELDGYTKANDKRFYKVNYEKRNICYCPDNIIIDNGEVKRFDKSEYLLIDYFLINLRKKTIELYDKSILDSFPDGLNNIEKIEIFGHGDEKNITLILKNGKKVTIGINRFQQITSYLNEELKEVGYGFLSENELINNICLPNLEIAGDEFLSSNNNLVEFNMPKLKTLGDCCLYSNHCIERVNLQSVTAVGNDFLFLNDRLTSLNMPNLEKTGRNFLYSNYNLNRQNLNIPRLLSFGQCFLWSNPLLFNQYVSEMRGESKKK